MRHSAIDLNDFTEGLLTKIISLERRPSGSSVELVRLEDPENFYKEKIGWETALIKGLEGVKRVYGLVSGRNLPIEPFEDPGKKVPIEKRCNMMCDYMTKHIDELEKEYGFVPGYEEEKEKNRKMLELMKLRGR